MSGKFDANECVDKCCLLQAANLEAYLADIGIIFALDWFLDRCRSIPNVLGDCFTCAIVQHTCKGAADSLQVEADSSPLHDALIGSGLVNTM